MKEISEKVIFTRKLFDRSYNVYETSFLRFSEHFKEFGILKVIRIFNELYYARVLWGFTAFFQIVKKFYNCQKVI